MSLWIGGKFKNPEGATFVVTAIDEANNYVGEIADARGTRRHVEPGGGLHGPWEASPDVVVASWSVGEEPAPTPATTEVVPIKKGRKG